MDNKELIQKAKQAVKFCQERNLYRPNELEELKKNPQKLMSTSLARMELYLRAHPEAN